MAIRPHTTWRKTETTAFTKNKFKGNNDIISDIELETTLYVYEPQTFAELRSDKKRSTGDEDVEQSYKKYNDGGYYFINLVPYKEMPTVKVTITSQGGDLKMLQTENVLACYTNRQLPEIATKRIYSLVPLDNGISEEIKETLWEENNKSNIFNYDNTLKQTSFTLKKILTFERESGSMFFSRKFYINTPVPKDIDFINIKFKGGMPAVGETTFKNVKGSSLAKDLLMDGEKYWEIRDDDGKWLHEKNPWHPQYMEPIVTDNGIRWQPLWVWEWQYARAQWDGKYKFVVLDGGSNSNTRPSGNGGINLTGEYLYNHSSTYVPEYRRLQGNGSFLGVGAGKELNFILPYGVQYALKSELSCHRMLYLASNNNNTTTGTGGLFDFKYQDNSHNGARSYKTTGKWGSKTTMMVMDYAYDPSVFFITGKSKIYLTKIVPGAFRHSDGWISLCSEIMEGDIAYGGTSWTSKLGILKDIKDVNLGGDIAKIQQNGDNKMMLFPASIESLGGEDNWQTENMLNAVPIQGEEEPKIDLGLLDTKPMQIRTNATQGFYGSYIREEFNINQPGSDYQLSFELQESETIGQIMLNYHGAQELSIKLCTDTESGLGGYANIIKEYTLPSEYASNRQISGGISISWF